MEIIGKRMAAGREERHASRAGREAGGHASTPAHAARPHVHRGGKRRWRRRRQAFPPALLAGLAVAIVAAGLAFPALYRLQRENRALRARLADLSGAAVAARLNLLGAAPDTGADGAGQAVPRTPPSAGPDARAPEPVAVPAADRGLQEALRFAPNGLYRVAGTNAPAPFADALLAAYAVLQGGQVQRAVEIFGRIVTAYPDWPYGHFYLGVARRQRDSMEQARRLFTHAQSLGVLSPEGQLYLALALLFEGEKQQAAEHLRALKARVGVEPLAVGPLYYPATAPCECRRLIEALPALGGLNPVEGW